MIDPISDMRQLIAAELAEVHTTLPGVVVSYDGVTAVVRPALPKQLTSGAALAPPQIVSVPVCWPVGDVNGQQALISVPLKEGDPVKLSFVERALESWLAGSDEAPDDPRQFDLSDAFATPIMRPGTMAADTENVSIQYGPATLKLSPQGDLTFNVQQWIVNAEQATLNTPLTVNGHLTYTQGLSGSGGTSGNSMVIAGGVAFEGGSLTHNGRDIGSTHRHPNGMGGETEPPV